MHLTRAACSYLLPSALLAVALCRPSLADDTSLTAHPGFVGSLPLDGTEVHGTITSLDKGYQVVDARFSVDFPHCKIYSLDPANSAEYTIHGLSERTMVTLLLLDASGAIVARDANLTRRAYTAVVHKDLIAGQKYYLFVGVRDKPFPIPFSVKAAAGNPSSVDPIHLNPTYRLSLRSVNATISAGDVYFESSPAIIIDCASVPLSSNWIRVRAESAGVPLSLYALDARNEVEEASDSRRDPAEIVLPKGSRCVTLVVALQSDSDDIGKGSTTQLTLSAEAFAFDPRGGIHARIRNLLGDPVFSFLAGVIIAALIAWIFYRRSISVKELRLRLLLDDVLLAERPQQGGLALRAGDVELSYASLVKFRLENTGHGTIVEDSVRTALSVRLPNIQRIVAIASASKGRGWKPPSISGAECQVPFSRLEPGDWLEVSAICEQAEAQVQMPIRPSISGDIGGTSIRAVHSRTSLALETTLLLWGLFMILSLPIVLLDSVFDFMPHWWASMWTTVIPVVLAVHLVFLFGTRDGRAIVRRWFSLLPAAIRGALGRIS